MSSMAVFVIMGLRINKFAILDNGTEMAGIVKRKLIVCFWCFADNGTPSSHPHYDEP